MDDNITFLYIILFVIDLVSTLISFPGYLFILAVNILDLIKNKRLDISDQLISGIGLFLLLHRLEYTNIDYICITNSRDAISQYTQWIQLFYVSIIFCTLLFSTWLSIHFCLKIVNINHNLYISIPRMFPKMFPWILLRSVLASVVICAPPALIFAREQVPNSNNTLQNPRHSFVKVFPFFAFSTLCLLLFFSSALNIILSLHRHITQLHKNSLGFRSQTVEAHVTAVKTVLSLLTFNLFYFALMIFLIVSQLHQLGIPVFSLLYGLCHILGVPILIQGSSKLQKNLQTIWLYFSSLRKTLTRDSAV
ncbi:taste receptor type 2 member 1-like [Leptodactylus fuscus]|uniref:taste receptor type 2 member 1-like n=1 Tax=Leptodactylus fuscus TaxID=238119 RepID=UPI003F4E54CA